MNSPGGRFIPPNFYNETQFICTLFKLYFSKFLKFIN